MFMEEVNYVMEIEDPTQTSQQVLLGKEEHN